ncbi:TPA: hypothetical protein ACGPGC_003385 [Enterobacter hormaechei]|uniref:hypothetical protein n=1 Tax=Enterobacter cloacae TaxID=550 RepID=UPI00246940AD|nr:hypothetical protein [Enterobacter cloacae]WGL80944.1 hypothetical protein QFB83_15950 [Enterobacter cloacae]
MKFVNPDYLLQIFRILTNFNHDVEFNINDKNAVIMNVIENDEMLSATLFSMHDTKSEANIARVTYKAAFKNYRDSLYIIAKENERILKDAGMC